MANKGGRPKGLPKTGGRKRGTPNRMTTELKTMILNALAKSGGEAYLVDQATENPRAFLVLLGRVLPLQVHGDPEHPLNMAVKVTFVRPH